MSARLNWSIWKGFVHLCGYVLVDPHTRFYERARVRARSVDRVALDPVNARPFTRTHTDASAGVQVRVLMRVTLGIQPMKTVQK